MFCQYCGTEMADAANFCHKCGNDRRNTAVVRQQPSYELCHLDTKMGFLGDVVIAAVGDHEIARLPLSHWASERPKVWRTLESQLIAEGWEPLAWGPGGDVIVMRRPKRT